MKTDKFHYYSMVAFTTIFPFLIGGYYSFTCALASIILSLLLVISVFRNRALNISLSFESAVILGITILYFFTKFWAVDKSMSLYGFVKLSTVLLYLLNLLQIESENRPKLLYTLPVCAAFMSASTWLLGQIEGLYSRFFDIAGDLHGAFEYANAFAAFCMIAVIVAIFKPKKNKVIIVLDVLCALICCAGIYLSNARAVILLTMGILVVCALYFIVSKLKTKKAKSILFGVIAVVGAATLAIMFATGIASTLTKKILSDGPFVERLLFWHDSFIYALHHPFGKGAYAFYYAQPQFQSAFYYAIDVHNDYLQMMVEIGIIPALCFIVLLVKQLFSKKTNVMQKMIILALAAHSFMDYDLQFISLFVLLLLCFHYSNEKKFTVKSKLIPAVLATGVIAFNGVLGLSAFYNYTGNQLKSSNLYKNTSALLMLMQSSNDQQFGFDIANEILAKNDCVFEANHTLANIYAANQKYDKALQQMELVLKKEPRNMENYEDYIDLCVEAESYYAAAGEKEKSREVSKKIVGIEKTLADLKAHTNPRAIKYARKQNFRVDKAHQSIIDEHKKTIKNIE